MDFIFKTYGKARKVFKFPHISFYTYSSHYGFNLYSSDVRLKSKWDYICIEDCPKLEISLFKRTFGFNLGGKSKSKYEDGDSYWESLVSYLYLYDKDLQKTLENMGNYIELGTKEKYPILSQNYLRKKGRYTS